MQDLDDLPMEAHFNVDVGMREVEVFALRYVLDTEREMQEQ